MKRVFNFDVFEALIFTVGAIFGLLAAAAPVLVIIGGSLLVGGNDFGISLGAESLIFVALEGIIIPFIGIFEAHSEKVYWKVALIVIFEVLFLLTGVISILPTMGIFSNIVMGITWIIMGSISLVSTVIGGLTFWFNL